MAALQPGRAGAKDDAARQFVAELTPVHSVAPIVQLSRKSVSEAELAAVVAEPRQIFVGFGDGVSGARLPSGTNSVQAAYRKGIGVEGNVAAGSLTQLMTRPLGLKSVSNPLAAEGKAGQPAKKGNTPGSAYAYNIKALRDREIELARYAEQTYERFVSQWQPRRKKQRTGAANEERH